MATPLDLIIAIEGKPLILTAEACRTLEHILIQVAKVTLQGDDAQIKLFEPTTGNRQSFTFKGGETVKRLDVPK